MRKRVWRIDGTGANATEGKVVWAGYKSVWNTVLFSTAIILGPVYFSWSAFLVFLVLTYVTLLIGHSLGMHRRLIHKSFECSKPFERFLVYLGVLVGMSGPFGVIHIHDIRDWAQRQSACHDFFAHRRGVWIDAFWQLHCSFQFANAPSLTIEPEFLEDPWYRFMEKTWWLHQLALGILLYSFGGIEWLVWGVAVRVSVSVTSHWVVTYFAHNPGPGHWLVKDAAVQASNLEWWSFLTHGECWHNNHHVFPESACMGIEEGQLDTGWLALLALRRLGLVHNLGLPRSAMSRSDLIVVEHIGKVTG